MKKKVFTKKRNHNIIIKNYNPLKVNFKISERDDVMEKLKKELSLKERIIVKLFQNTFNKVYDITRINIVNNLIK